MGRAAGRLRDKVHVGGRLNGCSMDVWRGGGKSAGKKNGL